MASKSEAQVDRLLMPQDGTSRVDAAIWKPAGGWHQFQGGQGREKGKDWVLEDLAIRPAVYQAQSPSLRVSQHLRSRWPGCGTCPAREMLQTKCRPHDRSPPNCPWLKLLASPQASHSLPPTVTPHY